MNEFDEHYTVGNRLGQEVNGGTVYTYTYDSANRLIEIDVTGTAWDVDFTWDDNGNLLSDGTSVYTYTHANRLAATSWQTNLKEFEYNGLGDRVRQTANGVSKTFVLDSAAGLTQVLADDNHAYLYGLGRIAQQGESSTDYFLGDALGSVRQLVDGDGVVRLVRTYDPYGDLMDSAGSGASSFGFTGEAQMGALVYLRARFYAARQGRFTQIDPSRLEANLYLYAAANPINLIDPSGLIVKREGIEDKEFVYSCNCGWIDFGHANPSTTDNIFRLLKAKVPPPPNVDNDRRVIRLTINTPIRVGLPYYAVVMNNTIAGQKEIALGIFMEFEEHREWWQGRPILKQHGKSYYSEEDLTSDLIGYYMSVHNKRDARTDDETWLWLSGLCGFPANREEAMEWSLDVFDSYPGFIQGVKEWGTPRLVCSDPINERCNDSGLREWPTAFQEIIPKQPAFRGDWWWYHPWLDGNLVGSANRDIYFLTGRY